MLKLRVETLPCKKVTYLGTRFQEVLLHSSFSQITEKPDRDAESPRKHRLVLNWGRETATRARNPKEMPLSLKLGDKSSPCYEQQLNQSVSANLWSKKRDKKEMNCDTLDLQACRFTQGWCPHAAHQLTPLSCPTLYKTSFDTPAFQEHQSFLLQ